MATSNVIDPFLVSFGVQLASSWVNMMLYMLELVMCFRYFQRAARPLPHKIGVGAMVLFDTLCTMSVNANVFVILLGFFGKESFMAILIPTTTTIFFTYLTAIVEQLFLCHLYFILSRRRVATLILVLLGVVHLAFSFAGGIMVQTAPFLSRLTFTITAVGAILCAVNDLLIAGCLGYELHMSQVKKSQSGTPNLLRRMTILSLSSGALVASTTLLMLILLLKGNSAYDFFFACQGRVYALTLLVNFLSSSSTGTSASSSLSSSRDAMVFHGQSSEKKSAPSLYSNSSEDSINKDLPPLPFTPTITIASPRLFTSTDQFASPSSAPYSASSLPV